MKALCWHGTGDVRIDNVPDPKIQDPRDAIIKITSSGICGSDLHLLDGFMPTMEKGDVLGHEPMGVVEEVGSAVTNLKKGDRVVVPFTISCGECFFCKKTLFSCCDTIEPQRRDGRQGDGPLAGRPVRLLAHAGRLRRRPGRVPARAVTPTSARSRSESGLPDEKVLFLSDIFPTGYMAAENAEIEPGDTVAVWGCGPVAQFAIKSAWMFEGGPGHRHRPRARAAEDGAGAGQGRDDQLQQGRRSTTAAGDDQGRRAGPLHRRGRLRGARDRQPRRGGRTR